MYIYTNANTSIIHFLVETSNQAVRQEVSRKRKQAGVERAKLVRWVPKK